MSPAGTNGSTGFREGPAITMGLDPRPQNELLIQIDFQLETLLRQADALNLALRAHDISGVFACIQHILYAAANVSKACWGSKGRLKAARKPLRDRIGINDESAIQDVDMRNNWDHFDERIDDWAKKGRSGFVDMNIGPISAFKFNEPDNFRLFDPRTTDVWFWGDRFNIQQIVSEASRLLPKVRAALGLPEGPPRPPGVYPS
jgi:hypothetical protein